MAHTSTCDPPKSTSIRRQRQSNQSRILPFDLPYFAHQQLDPSKYHASIGLPVGKPIWGPGSDETTATPNERSYNDISSLLREESSADFDFDSQGPQLAESSCTGKKDDNNDSIKRVKVIGGRPPIPKRVTADLDSDDELIVRMKKAKYLEKDIAKRMADEGRMAYHPKTIGTRWARLRIVLQEREDQLLDAEMTDWHEGDDDVLYKAVRKADELVAKAKADAESKKWRIVADQMQQLKVKTKNACRERYHNLQIGTARPTPESILNPDEITLGRIQSRRDKERTIAEDLNAKPMDQRKADNVEGNAWTSKRRKYF